MASHILFLPLGAIAGLAIKIADAAERGTLALYTAIRSAEFVCRAWTTQVSLLLLLRSYVVLMNFQ
jgi:hypothetical protein